MPGIVNAQQYSGPDMLQVGPVSPNVSLAPASNVGIRGGQMGDLIVSHLQGDKYENTYRNNRFGACMQAVLATALSTGLTATYTGGLVLFNPVNSPVNIALDTAMFAQIIAQTSVSALGIGVGNGLGVNPTATTPTNLARNKKVGGPTGFGVSWSMASVTLPVAMTLDTVLGTATEGIITSDPGLMPGYFELKGGIVLAPGCFCAFTASAGLIASSYILGLEWTEIPV